jgi:aspartate 1-decarboxylase
MQFHRNEPFRKLLRAKIHRATVTEANVDYEGSITIPPDLMEAGDFVENEAVWVWNVTTGTRFETYTILGAPHSRDICVNGAAAHLVKPGDLVIIAAFTDVPESLVREVKPKVVFVDDENRMKELRPERLPEKETPRAA